MRHILAALTLGAALALSTSAAFAGDNDLLSVTPVSKTTSAVAQSDTQIVAPAGSEMALPWYTELRFENIDR